MPEKETGHDTSELKKVVENTIETTIGKKKNGFSFSSAWNLINLLSICLIGIIGYLWNSLNLDFKEHIRQATEIRDEMNRRLVANTTNIETLQKEDIGIRAEIREIVIRIEKQLEKLDEKLSKFK